MLCRRVNIRAILANPAERRKMFVSTLIAIQAREGITTTQEQAEAAYDRLQEEKARVGQDLGEVGEED